MTTTPRLIDAHAHLYSAEMAPSHWIDTMAAYGSAISGRPAADVRRRIEEDWYDPTGDRLVADMDAAGIEKSIIFLLDFGPYSGVYDDISLARRYELYAAAVERHPDRLVFYGGIDPRRPDAVQLVERGAREWGMQGIKIWTPAGVYPNESYCYRLYEKCAELGLIVFVHTGQEIGPLRSECTRPMYVDQPANDFPELTFVLAHAGMSWTQEAADIAWHHHNVYLDIAYWQAKYLRSPEMFATELRNTMSLAGAHRVFFGSDWPAMRTVPRVKPDVWVDVLRGFAKEAPGGVRFEQREIDLLMGDAAAAVLGL